MAIYWKVLYEYWNGRGNLLKDTGVEIWTGVVISTVNLDKLQIDFTSKSKSCLIGMKLVSFVFQLFRSLKVHLKHL